jgi:hypothetical protein
MLRMVIRMIRLIQGAPRFLATFLQIPVQYIAGLPGVGIRFAKSPLGIALQLFGGLARLFTSVIFLALRTGCQRTGYNQQR